MENLKNLTLLKDGPLLVKVSASMPSWVKMSARKVVTVGATVDFDEEGVLGEAIADCEPVLAIPFKEVLASFLVGAWGVLWLWIGTVQTEPASS